MQQIAIRHADVRLLLVALGLLVVLLSTGCMSSRCVLDMAKPIRQGDSTRAFWMVDAVQSAHHTTNGEIAVFMTARPPNSRHSDTYRLTMPVRALSEALSACTFIRPHYFETPNWPYEDLNYLLLRGHAFHAHESLRYDSKAFTASLPLIAGRVQPEASAGGGGGASGGPATPCRDAANRMPVSTQPIDWSCLPTNMGPPGSGVCGELVIAMETLYAKPDMPECLYYGNATDGNAWFVYVSASALYQGRRYLPFIAPTHSYENKWRRCCIVLLPVAFIFDVVTFPIQAVVIVADGLHQLSEFQLP